MEQQRDSKLNSNDHVTEQSEGRQDGVEVCGRNDRLK